jgi:hypothetical protein
VLRAISGLGLQLAGAVPPLYRIFCIVLFSLVQFPRKGSLPST